MSEDTQQWKPMVQDLYSHHECKNKWPAYKYEYWAVEYEYIDSEYGYRVLQLSHLFSYALNDDRNHDDIRRDHDGHQLLP